MTEERQHLVPRNDLNNSESRVLSKDVLYETLEISDRQAKLIARAIVEDIAEYCSANYAAFEEFKKNSLKII